MGELPTGTVTMLFCDIEGSTLLLGRLGARYVEALDAHRAIMRSAWTTHGGTEMGTEGDSFFVVFPTADAAVAAATQAQRGLHERSWVGGERLTVRIGIHTGTPQVHQGGYWGMDVHRAARIAGSAHGGQVVVSAVTAELVRPGLPRDVDLVDLGFHHLKDLSEPEHLYQLAAEGLPHDFPALRSLGTSSSLPHPATPLVGRRQEVEELTTLLSTPDVRLVTLTGTGGAGKTRLATAVAERLGPRFPDGLFFVALASVTTAEVMWSSIAESMGVAPRDRGRDDLLASMARRSLLLVLDNLEQLPGADDVVAQVLDAAPHVVVLATSRQALGHPAERRVPVSPLALPDDETLGSALASSAVQLFVQRAVSVQPRFELTPENVADVVAVCRRLDGLPMAIELCAARVRVLGPHALLRRLDQALDFASTSRLAAVRQRTLRETIGWSYQLLTPAQRRFFRSLGVLSGGGDLDAVAAVTSEGEDVQVSDPVDAVADLVDVSLADVAEGQDGEPRVSLLQTLRAFAEDELRTAGELDDVRRRHAEHYLRLAERLRDLRETRHMTARSQADTELDNFRAALEWAVTSGETGTALRLCGALGWVWWMGGYVAEGRHWHERVIAQAPDAPSPQLAACLGGLANVLLVQGEPRRAHAVAGRSLAMARSVDDAAVEVFALGLLGTTEQQLGDLEAARTTLREALALHRRRGNQGGLARVLGNLAGIEEALGHLGDAEVLIRESLDVLDRLGDVHEATIQRQNLANLLAVSGRVEEADRLARGLVDTVLRLHNPNLTMAFANTVMNVLVRSGDPRRAALLFGAEEAMHERLGIPNPYQDEEREEALEVLDGAMSGEEWDEHRSVGRQRPVEELLAELGAVPDVSPTVGSGAPGAGVALS